MPSDITNLFATTVSDMHFNTISSTILDTVISIEGAQSHKGHHGTDPSAGVREQTAGTQDDPQCCVPWEGQLEETGSAWGGR